MMPFGFHPIYLFALVLLIILVVAVVTIGVGALRSYRTPPSTTYGMRSPDGRWWWDGSQWQPMPPDPQP